MNRALLAVLSGPVMALVVWGLTSWVGCTHETTVVLTAASWMLVWWVTEAVPLGVTSVLPLVLFPLFGVADIAKTSAPYGSKFVFLFMGGFLIALALERWNLHRRFALRILVAAGGRPRLLLAGFMVATAALSMWISNTATTLMMLPIALSVVTKIELDDHPRFPVALLLGLRRQSWRHRDAGWHTTQCGHGRPSGKARRDHHAVPRVVRHGFAIFTPHARSGVSVADPGLVLRVPRPAQGGHARTERRPPIARDMERAGKARCVGFRFDGRDVGGPALACRRLRLAPQRHDHRDGGRGAPVCDSIGRADTHAAALLGGYASVALGHSVAVWRRLNVGWAIG